MEDVDLEKADPVWLLSMAEALLGVAFALSSDAMRTKRAKSGDGHIRKDALAVRRACERLQVRLQAYKEEY